MNLRHLLPLLCAAALLPTAARAATLNVPAQYPTIQAGVNAAANGDIVQVAGGTYTGPGNRDIDFLGKNISVISYDGPDSTIIDCGGFSSSDGSGNHRGFYIHSGEREAVVSGFTVKNGYTAYVSGRADSSDGGGICIHGSGASVQDCVLTNNIAELGGGVCCYNDGPIGSQINLTHCTITANAASFALGGEGGGVYNANLAGTITVTDCTITSNTAQHGGGVFNSSPNGSGVATITLAGCTISGNTAAPTNGGDGGGVYNYIFNYYSMNSAIQLTNCTVVANSAQTGGGIYNHNQNGGADDTSGGTIQLTNCTVADNTGGGIFNYVYNINVVVTNCISYNNDGGEVVSDPAVAARVAVRHSDVRGGSMASGGIDADPMFVNASSGDFHLQPGSPCLGAGTTTGAPATDKDGRTRSSQPSIGAYELAALPVSHTVSHLLWGNVSGEAALWTVQPSGSFQDTAHYGPYSGWSAKALATTSTGLVHLLWTNTSGEAALWTVQPDGSYQDDVHYGPYPGWNALGLSAGPDGRLHLLWNHSPDNMMALWNFQTPGAAGGSYQNLQYGPYPNWQVKGVATGANAVTDLIWNNTDGTLAAWQVSEADGSIINHQYGPYAGGWTANTVAAGPDGVGLIGWSSASGVQTLWNENFASGSFSQVSFGPYSGWGVKSVAIGGDGLSRLLWSHGGDNEAALWLLDGSGGFTSTHLGPYSGWSVTALSAGQ